MVSSLAERSEPPKEVPSTLSSSHSVTGAKQRRGCIASLGTPRRMRLLVMVLSLPDTAAKDKTRGRDI